MPHATLPAPGLQALILCGPGVSLNTFTSTPADFPKALVPIANRPMVWYPLDWCYRMGISDVTLITPSESAPPLEAALATNPSLTSLPSPKADILAPEGLTQTTGTAELLRLPDVQKCIVNDFVLLPCDLVSELDGTAILQQWMTLNQLPFMGSKASKWKGGVAVFYPTQGVEGISTKKDETDFLATRPLASAAVPPPPGSLRLHVEEVVLSMPTDTLNDKIEEDKSFFRLRQSLLTKHGRVRMRTRHRDAHVYVFPHWIMDLIARNETFESVGEDVLGWWAKMGWQSGLARKLGLQDVLRDDREKSGETNDGLNEEDGVDPAALSSTKSQAPASTRTLFATRVPRASSAPSPQPSNVTTPALLAYVHPHTQPLIRRIDTTAQLLTVSLYLAKQPATSPFTPENKIHPTAKLEQQSRVSADDSLVAENVHLGFRSNVKESVIGANCEIGKNVRLMRCLLMEGVVVGDGVVMSGCVVGKRARIEGTKVAVSIEGAAASAAEKEGAELGAKKGRKKGGNVDGEEEERTKLTDCEVAPGFIVEAGTEAKGEKLMRFDTEEALDEEGEDNDEDE